MDSKLGMNPEIKIKKRNYKTCEWCEYISRYEKKGHLLYHKCQVSGEKVVNFDDTCNKWKDAADCTDVKKETLFKSNKNIRGGSNKCY